ncbi:hypothetical protein C9374_007749 [Naegleria lovaniensis]|uniref:DNA topoisomerase (ATP-hydrolyzing) n=1 Tax=Naegleria lovaniensis TaxID=51637 RepID=A0AA88GL31_NAELO|nr:uncharacterized protein C9374_007749 [Naegleria lovaniensis]KAG2379111.1 hypothetical protein C9374_007749 [Naegleria lovaniensis]
MIIEPKFYVPIIPMLLVNGAEGMGTGWSTSIPTFNPLDLIDVLNTLLDSPNAQNAKIPTLKMWARGFKGVIEQNGNDKFTAKGVYAVKQKGGSIEMDISELPIGEWTEHFKTHLLNLASKDVIKPKFSERNTESTVGFTITINSSEITPSLLKKLKLEKSFSMTNMTAFSANQEIVQYSNIEEMIKQFYVVRIEYYEKRKAYQIAHLEKQSRVLTNKVKFLDYITSGDSNLKQFMKTKREDLPSFLKTVVGVEIGQSESISYLTDMSLISLTMENKEKLAKQLETIKADLNNVKADTAKQMWRRDLQKLKEELISLKQQWIV